MVNLSIDTIAKTEGRVNQSSTIDTLSKIAKAPEISVGDLMQK